MCRTNLRQTKKINIEEKRRGFSDFNAEKYTVYGEKVEENINNKRNWRLLILLWIEKIKHAI